MYIYIYTCIPTFGLHVFCVFCPKKLNSVLRIFVRAEAIGQEGQFAPTFYPCSFGFANLLIVLRPSCYRAALLLHSWPWTRL